MSGFRGMCAGVVHGLLFYTLYNPFYSYELAEIALILVLVAVVRCLILQQETLNGFRNSLLFSWVFFPLALVVIFRDMEMIQLLVVYWYIFLRFFLAGAAGTVLALVVTLARQRSSAVEKSDPRAPEL